MNTEALSIIHELTPYNRDTFSRFLQAHMDGLSNHEEKMQTMLDEFELTVFNDMTPQDMFDSAILIATQNIQHDIEYDKLATRILLTSIYRDAFEVKDDTEFEQLYRKNFKNYVHKGIQLGLLNPEIANLFDLDTLAAALMPERDDIYKFIGLSTLRNRYGLHDRKDTVMETPQFTWMRVAMGLALLEDNPTNQALSFYDKLSAQKYIPGGSTNIGAGTTFSVLSNCYLIDTEDDIHSIFNNVKNVALISKATGGIGISVTKLRSSGSKVTSNNTISTGPIPFVKVMDTALKSMSRGGKKYGAMCIYMENWHLNFQEFIDLRQNNGDDYRRIRTANTAVYISDEFMKRVVNNDTWYFFNPQETPDLPELYGEAFGKRYTEYAQMAERGELEMYDTIPARELMKRMLTVLLSTSHPWLTWKDAINVRALNNNTGTIHSSNLCTEITLPQDQDNIAVCNLAYVNLTQHVRRGAQSIEEAVNWDDLEDTVRVLMRHLDNLIDVNELPVAEAKKSDGENRAVGMGLSGLSESLELLGLAYDSQEAYNFMDKVTEFISYVSIDESCNLAEERGAYDNFEGSMWSKGYVPVDTVAKLAAEREGKEWDGSPVNTVKRDGSDTALSGVQQTLASLQNRIEKGSESATSEESRELYDIFEQLTHALQNSIADKKQESSTTQSSAYAVPNESGEGITLRQSMTTTMDWEALRERVKKGVRNATTMAIAPNASTGLVLGTSPGIDPRFAQIFSRQTSNGKFLDINHNLVRDLQEQGIWEEVKDQVLQNYGDISTIEEIPDQLKEVYKTSFQISPYAYIEVASRAQKWIDQAMSRNMYLSTRDINEMVDIYTEAWRRGLKTTYYLHSKPRHQAEQSTVRVNKREGLNKQGFAASSKTVEVQIPVAQPRLEGGEPKKGFGFAAPDNPEKEIDATPPAEKESAVITVGGGGFGAAMQKAKTHGTIQEKAQRVAPKKKMDILPACPIDPAERAQCEACQ